MRHPTAAEAATIREAVASRGAPLPESPVAGSPADRLRQRAAATLTAAECDARTIPAEHRKAQILAPTDPERASRLWGEAEDTAPSGRATAAAELCIRTR
jgi:hypothetical protein